MSELDFDVLSAHLSEVSPVFDEFCARSSFRHVAELAIGRYPRIRIERDGDTKLWFDFWMELDKHGARFQKFSRDLPYELAAGAYFVERDHQRGNVRFQSAIQCFSGKPFDKVRATLLDDLRENLKLIELWDHNYLREHGAKIQLGRQR